MKALDSRDKRYEWNKEKVQFTDACSAMLQMRKSVFKTVDDELRKNKKADVLFLCGGSGAGKSTTMCFLDGLKMIWKFSCYECENREMNATISHA